MAYTIKRTNGVVIATIPDSDAVNISVNTNYSVALLGKHSPNYGEIFNTNFIRLLENSANPAAPGTPLLGQLWFDSTPSNLGLNVCIGEASGSTPATFNPVALLTRSATQPSGTQLGKLWHDTTTNQLKSYNGTGNWVPIGVTNLDSLTDVTITTPADGQVLKYNSTTSTWVNGTDATGSGGSGGTTLPANAAGVLANDGTGVLSWTAVGGSALPSQSSQNGKYLRTNGTSASWATIAYSDIGSPPVIPAAQIQSDWSQTLSAALDFIKNKPTIPAAQIQSDWNQTTTTALDFIKNKPTIPTSTAVSSSDVAGAIAGLTAGAIGTYTWAGAAALDSQAYSEPNFNLGGTIAGSRLVTTASTLTPSTIYTGTWQAMSISQFIPYAVFTPSCGPSDIRYASYSLALWMRVL